MIQFNIATPTLVRVHNGTCIVEAGTSADANVTLTIGDDDLIAMLLGQLDGMTAFMAGKLQVAGDLMLAQQIGGLFDAARLA